MSVKHCDAYLVDPGMYEVVNENDVVASKGKKRKRGPSSQLEGDPKPKSKKSSTAKCRGVYGAEKRDLWCKACKNKHRCTKFLDQ